MHVAETDGSMRTFETSDYRKPAGLRLKPVQDTAGTHPEILLQIEALKNEKPLARLRGLCRIRRNTNLNLSDLQLLEGEIKRLQTSSRLALDHPLVEDAMLLLVEMIETILGGQGQDPDLLSDLSACLPAQVVSRLHAHQSAQCRNLSHQQQ